MFKSRIDRVIFCDFLKSLFTVLVIIFGIAFTIFGGISVCNEIVYNAKYHDIVNERVLSGYSIYIDGNLVDSDKISVYVYPNSAIRFDDNLRCIYIGTSRRG